MELDTILAAVAYPFEQAWRQLADNPGSRYFFPFIVVGTVTAVMLARSGNARAYREALTPKYWLGASARVDYILTAINPLIKLVVFGSLIMGAASLGQRLSGGGVIPEAPIWSLTILLTVTLFLADDFMRFFTHWLMHRVPFMWSFHRVHHSAETMTFATADRHHFMEVLFVTTPLVATYALVNGLFIVLTGIEQSPLALAGANLLLVLFNLGAGAFRHGPAWVSFGSGVERWLISPAMHQIHHSVDPRHYDTNLGGALTIWDRMFGTHYIPSGPEELEKGIGLGEDGRVLNTALGHFVEPFQHAIRSAIPEDHRAQAPTTE